MTKHKNLINDIVRIDSGKPGPTILLLGGVHGNEKSGAVYLQKFSKDLQEGKINVDSGKIVVIHTANKCGFNNNSRYVPGLEYDDINRNFPKEKNQPPRVKPPNMRNAELREKLQVRQRLQVWRRQQCEKL